MKSIFFITIKSALCDPFLIFWSVVLPIIGSIVLGHIIQINGYHIYIMTGMSASSVFFYSLINTSYTIIGNRRRGVYNLLRVTPMKLWQYIFSVSVAWTLISVFLGILVITICVILFYQKLSIFSILLIFPVLFFSAMGYILLSFFISSLARNESQLSMITNILIIPVLFCSDAFYFIEKAPPFIKYISKINPFQWFINGLRNAITTEVYEYSRSIILLIFFIIISLILTLRTFKFSE